MWHSHHFISHSNLGTMPKRRAGVTARISNFGHKTQPSKKARGADKENASSHMLSPFQGKSSKSGQNQQPLLVHANGLNVTIPVPRPYMEEVDDDDRAPAIDPLPFDLPETILQDFDDAVKSGKA
jgi:hypothetical protein